MVQDIYFEIYYFKFFFFSLIAWGERRGSHELLIQKNRSSECIDSNPFQKAFIKKKKKESPLLSTSNLSRYVALWVRA